MANKKQFEQILTQDLSFPWDKLYKAPTKHLVSQYSQWKGHQLTYDTDERVNELTANLVFLLEQLNNYLQSIPVLESEYSEFYRRFSHASDVKEQHEHILQFSLTLGANSQQLKQDKNALNRWFDLDAITERYQHLKVENEAKLIFAISRLPTAIETLWQGLTQPEKLALFKRHKLDKVLMSLLIHKGSERLKVTTFKSLSQLIIPFASTNLLALPSDMVRYIYRFAVDKSQPLWCQVEALNLIGRINSTHLEEIYDSRLQPATDINNESENHSDNDLFFRYHLVLALKDNYVEHPNLLNFIPTLLKDDKPFVRKAFSEILTTLPYEVVINILPQLLNDSSEAVQAACILQLPALIKHHKSHERYLELLQSVLNESSSEFVLRVALTCVTPSFFEIITLVDKHQAETLTHVIEQQLTTLNTQADNTKVRRWAAQAREQLWASLFTHSHELEELLTLAPEKSRRLSKAQRSQLLEEENKRWLASQLSDDFGFNLTPRRATRDSKTGFRLWRFLFEWRTPSTDKRQNYDHTKGRKYDGLAHIPAHNLAEISATKVPGEPLHIEDEGNWRPYLPLVDQLISCLDQNWPTKPLKIYSSEGVTFAMPPSSFVRRLYARTQLTVKFDYYAKLRNWTPDSQERPDEYLNALHKLGFTFSIEPHQDSRGNNYPLDQRVQHFFPVAIFPPFIINWWQQYQSYFFSVYQNTLSQLGMFLSAMLATFFAVHIKSNMQLKRARKSIPLVIGGWGTRGKSGTERLKAALFNGLGFSVLSKTSGCEAMFLHARKGKPLAEMFLFRPYDKATIWEQVSVTRIAKKLKSDVMLWECMGLTPRYIEILQQQWMKDDIATITNCYPDHEDLQGPAGVDIPKVMMKFVPKNSMLITTEENMLPYLKVAANKNKSDLVAVNWLDAGLITTDIMARFPYQEHPSNIALVLSLAKQMGIDETYALKEMADRVVPDLGVLKSFPVANVNGRKLQFINGMSANERFGALGNWRRTGLDTYSLSEHPNQWITTLINNRDDRVARSQVFADLVVQDISADCHVVIGNNLSGFMGFVKQSWHTALSSQFSSSTDIATISETWQQYALKLRVPMSVEHITQRHAAMCQGINISQPPTDFLTPASYDESVPEAQIAAIIAQHKHDYQKYNQYQIVVQQINALKESPNDLPQVIAAIQTQLWQWFEAKFIVIQDYHASGAQIIHEISKHSPPGLHNSIMGLQNIKGTGLDVVYKWQAWERNYQLCQKLRHKNEVVARDALASLTKVRDFSLLDQSFISAQLAEAENKLFFQTELCQAQIEMVKNQLKTQIDEQQINHSTERSSLIEKLVNVTEAFLDAGDAVKRRKKANILIEDLVNERISQENAAKELLKLTQKQKGGWLSRYLQKQ